jgi:hypothetical protein
VYRISVSGVHGERGLLVAPSQASRLPFRVRLFRDLQDAEAKKRPTRFNFALLKKRLEREERPSRPQLDVGERFVLASIPHGIGR